MQDWLIVVIMGGVFFLVGLGVIFWGRGEEKSYYDAISNRTDVREFLEHEPRQPESEGLRVGGWIALFVGLLLLVLGGFVLR